MKPFICVLLFLSGFKVFSQNTPFAVWEDQANSVYRFVTIDAATGIRSNISILPNMTGFVAGDISALNPDSNYYHYVALYNSNYFLITIDLATGNTVYNVQLSSQLAGVEYNCGDSTL